MQLGVARSSERAESGRFIPPSLALLEKTPILLETLLRDLPDELLDWKPAPERWSIAEVLGHLVDIEQVYADRTRRMVTEDTPILQKFGRAGSESSDGEPGSAMRHLETFNRMRRATLVLLRSIPGDAVSRTASHSELGTITLGEMLNEWASHDLGHLRQIAELYRAHAFHPHSGPFQRYSDLKP